MNILDLIPKERQRKALAIVKQLARAEVLEPYRFQRIAKDGRIVEVWLSATALMNEAGEAYAIATTEREIRERNGDEGSSLQAGSPGMAKRQSRPDDFADLRRRAEEMVRARRRPRLRETLSPEEAQTAAPRTAGASDRAGDAERGAAAGAERTRSLAGAVFRSLRSCAGGLFHPQRTGADPGGQPHGGRSAGRGQKRSGQAALDPLHPSRGPGRLLPPSQATF